MTAGSLQLRRFRIAHRAGKSLMTACVESGLSLAEAKLTLAADAADPPPPEAYEPIGTTRKESTMARKAKPGDTANGVTNLSDTKATIKDAVTKILGLKNKRKEINAAIAEHRARVKNCGVPPASLDLAIRMKEADPEDRQMHDEGYAIARDALGLRFRASLFDDLDERAEAEEMADAGPPQAPLKGDIAKAAARAGMIEGYAPDAMN